MDPGKPAVLLIESTRSHAGNPACLLTWGPVQWYADLPAIRATALDLMACATYAEMMITLVVKAGIPPDIVSGFATEMLGDRDKRYFGDKQTVLLMPAGSSQEKEPMVLMKRGSVRGYVRPDEARAMAIDWLGAAEATESDHLITEAMQAAGAPEQVITNAFAYLYQLRTRKNTGENNE